MLKPFIMTTLLSLSFGSAAQAADQQYDLRVDGLTCPFCVATSTKALKKIDGVTHVSADLKSGLISVCAAEGTDLSDARMTKLFRKKGFTYRSQIIVDTCQIFEPGEGVSDHIHKKSDTGSHSIFGSDYKADSNPSPTNPEK